MKSKKVFRKKSKLISLPSYKKEWIGSSAVENQCDEGALDFQGPDKRSDIGIGSLSSWIGSSAVENQCDEGASDFQGPDKRSDIGIGSLSSWIGSSVG